MKIKRIISMLAAVATALVLFCSACTPTVETKTHTVTFDYNDGVRDSYTVEVDDGAAVAEPETDPERTGYTFEYWYSDDEDEGYVFTTPVTEDLTLRAKWSIRTFVVTVNEDDENVRRENVQYGEKFSKPADPEKEGYTFDGWFTDELRTKPYDFNSAVYNDVTIYAKWINVEATYYTVTYNYNYDGAPESKSVSVEENSKIIKPEDPVRGGYKFIGWFEDREGGTLYDFEKSVTGDKEIFACWEEIVGPKNYKFEAELTDFSSLKGTGFSSEAEGPTMIQNDIGGKANASNGFWIGYMYLEGCSLTFVFNSETEVKDATLKLRLSGELVNTVVLNNKDFTVALNNETLKYNEIRIEGITPGTATTEKREFQDFVVGENLTLKAGENTVKLTVTNKKPLTGTDGNAAGGKVSATAPLIDCIKITTTAKLSWTPYPDLLTERFDWWDFETEYEGIVEE